MSGRLGMMARATLALALGAAGGAMFFRLALPLPWMIGSMGATLCAALAGAPVRLPPPLRSLVLPVIGIMLGSAFTPEVVAAAPRWVPTLLTLFAYLGAAASVGYLWFRRLGRLDPVTAFFCAVPGGLAEMTAVGTALGGDERAISLTHAVRIVLVVALIPPFLRFFGEVTAGSTQTLVGTPALGGFDAALMAVCALAGAVLAARLRLPAAAMLGPMLLSAAIHGQGWSAARPPAELVAAAQVVLGASIGCRFAGAPLGRIGSLLAVAAGANIVTLAVSMLFAVGLAACTGLPWTGLLIAYAPGGMAEMSLVALALGLDAAFVTTHHIARVLMMIVLAPAAFGAIGPGRGGARD